ncbi:MAG: elongation factor P [Elusimicrobia bacterium]|nr:elongation factor P [Elusimicrobiota bacterium]
MVYTTDFHEGLIFEDENGQYVEIMQYQHHRKSQARAVVRVKLRNLKTGSVTETSYRPEDKFKDVDVEKRPKTYMYTEGSMAHFMDNENYEQIALPLEKLGVYTKFLVENMGVSGIYLNGEFFNVELAANVVLEVSSTVPGVKGDSVANLSKPATLSSGMEIKVPLFINQGDKIRVDTRTGEYIERVTDDQSRSF